MLNSYYASAANKGIEVSYESPVVDIVIERGRAVGVVATVDGRDVLITAKAVVVASGGFEANRHWLREYWGEAAERFVVRGSSYNVGGPLRALLDRGARSVGDPKGVHAISVDARAPDYDGGIVTRIDSVPLSIMVNRGGVRFADEGEDLWPRRYASWGRLIAAQPGQIAFSIYDSKVRNKFIPGLYPPHEAQTLEELARLADLPWSTLEQTVCEFNAAVRNENPFHLGILDGRRTVGLAIDKTNWALAIDSPPFYAYPLRPGITFTYLGLKVDRDARVHFADGPIANLFAAGEIMSGNVLTAGYLAGFGLTIGTVFGRIAGTGAGQVAASER
jgi:tricarballylate dehydrogenase